MEDFILDFAGIDRLELRELNITENEVISVFVNKTSFADYTREFDYLIGFSNRRKFVQIAYQVHKNPKFDIEILQVDLPYENDIKEYWCKNQR